MRVGGKVNTRAVVAACPQTKLHEQVRISQAKSEQPVPKKKTEEIPIAPSSLPTSVPKKMSEEGDLDRPFAAPGQLLEGCESEKNSFERFCSSFRHHCLS